MIALDLTKIRTPRERFEQIYRPEQLTEPSDTFRVVAPVQLAFDIFKDKDQYRLIGRVQTVLELVCSRCLEPFTEPIDAAFDLRYQPHTFNTGDGELEVEEDDLGTAFYEHEQVDLGQLMSEQFYLALAMKPLCSEACKGLCPSCGTNLNRETCACSVQWEDPRFAVLRALKKDS